MTIGALLLNRCAFWSSRHPYDQQARAHLTTAPA